MSIKTHFQDENIPEEVQLTPEEEQELAEWLEELYQMQARNKESIGESYDDQDTISLAGLAFVAGRSYQREIDKDEQETLDQASVAGVDFARELERLESQGLVTIRKETLARMVEAMFGGE